MNHYGKTTEWSLIYFLIYVYLNILAQSQLTIELHFTESLVQETRNEKSGQSFLTEPTLMSETNPGLQNDIIVASQSSSRADPAEIESTNKIEDNVIDRGVPQPSNFKCPFCGNKYDSRDTVEKHLELFHKMPIEVQKSMQLQNIMQIEKGMS